MHQVEIKKSFPVSKQKLFRYFTHPALVEKWSYPDGMTLEVPLMEAKPGGRYRYEHTTDEGTYICEGHFQQISPEKIVQVDDFIKDPSGKTLSSDLEGIITLEESNGSTEVKVIQKGFDDEKFAQECRKGWNESFAHLEDLIGKSGRGLSKSA